ncbi:MAG: hypothetical protein HYX52_07140 [Chloroflexi bacterium]|nr:hypothetical protein [Chloroflexota bacterium]
MSTRAAVTHPPAPGRPARWSTALGVLLLAVAAATLVGWERLFGALLPACGGGCPVFAPWWGGALATCLMLLGSAALAWITLREERLSRSAWLVVGGVAVLARVLLVVGAQRYGLSLGPRGVALDDESSYDYAARWLVVIAREPARGLPFEFSHLPGPYLHLLGALYTLITPSVILGRVLGALQSLLLVLVGAAFAVRLAGPRAAALTGLLIALMPGILVWSPFLLKDTLIAVTAASVLLAVVQRGSRHAPLAFGVLASGLLVLVDSRAYVGLAEAGVVAVVGLVRVWNAGWRRRVTGSNGAFRARRIRRGAVLALAGLVVVGLGVGFATVARSALGDNPAARLLYYQVVLELVPPPVEPLGEALVGWRPAPPVGGFMATINRPDGGQDMGMIVAERRSDVIVATTRDDFEVVPRSRLSSVEQIEPVWAVRALVQRSLGNAVKVFTAPLTTGMPSALYVGMGVDALVWLATLAAGTWLGLRTHGLPWLRLPVAFAWAMLLLLSLVSGNPGNLVRQRAALTYPVLLMCIAAGLTHRKWPSAALPSRVRAPTPLAQETDGRR